MCQTWFAATPVYDVTFNCQTISQIVWKDKPTGFVFVAGFMNFVVGFELFIYWRVCDLNLILSLVKRIFTVIDRPSLFLIALKRGQLPAV